jgi:hypothetical protein
MRVSLAGVEMEESVTYQAIIEKGVAIGEAKGEAKGERRTLLLVGKKRFGPPPPEVVAALEAINDPERLDQLSLRLLDVTSWQELLNLPPS